MTMMRTCCSIILALFLSVLLVGICTGSKFEDQHNPGGCDFPYNCDGRSPLAICHEREGEACENKLASCADSETCCSAYELQWKCKHISTDLHLDSRFTGYTSFFVLESVGAAGGPGQPQGQPHGGRITTPQGEDDSNRVVYKFPATTATHLKFPRLRSVNNDVAIVGLPYLKELNMKEFEYWYTNSGSKGQTLGDHSFLVAENDKLTSIVLPKYTASPASCLSDHPQRPCRYPDNGNLNMGKNPVQPTVVLPLVIMDNPELKWLVTSNTNLDGLAHPHGPTLFQSGNSEEVKIIAVSKNDYPSWLHAE